MKLFQPHVHIIRRSLEDGKYGFFLHAHTLVNNLNYRAGSSSEPVYDSKTNTFRMTIDIVTAVSTEEVPVPSLDAIVPVLHAIDLGELNFNGSGSKVEVTVLVDNDPKGRTVISDDEIDDDEKPF